MSPLITKQEAGIIPDRYQSYGVKAVVEETRKMGKFSISLPDYAGIRCGNSDYGAKQTENITLHAAVFPNSSNYFRVFQSKVSCLSVDLSHQTDKFAQRRLKELNDVN